MTKTSLLRKLIPGSFAAAVIAIIAAAPAQAAGGPKALKLTTSGANTSGSIFTLDHPALNGKSKLNLIAIHNFQGNYNNHAFGFQYNSTLGRWQIQNEDNASIALNETFNILLAPGAKRMPVNPLTVGEGNIAYFPTIAKNKPHNLLLANHLISIGNGFEGVRLTDPFSTFYWAGNGNWSIYTDNNADMKAVAFNIADVTTLKVAGTPVSFLVTSNAGNVASNQVAINNPLTTGKPNAVVFARHLYSNEASPTYMTKEVGVWYNGVTWKIYTEDQSAMPINEAFVVTVIPTAAP
ncbi:hypothetical protein [Haloferula sp. BvORR071]|uniref:DUF7452 domain-containing protein n=1 Tax=Haloferula sp. BvORR071 TaxID=1396141 RepID=UPI000550133C|nr:hypothetical protein [Haloferula sp. BvORR071]